MFVEKKKSIQDFNGFVRINTQITHETAKKRKYYQMKAKNSSKVLSRVCLSL